MVNIIALYPGQGSQYPQMALDLYASSQKVRELFALASEQTKRDLYHLLENGSEEDLKRTEVTQLVVTLANRSAHLRLAELGYSFVCHSGFSLGELSAYAGAKILDDATLFTLVEKRSALMAEAAVRAEEIHGKLGMAAVIGMGYDGVLAILKENSITGLYPANDNGPSQVVISGLLSSMEEAKPLLMASGARRVLPLKVSGPFHTPFMDDATKEFSAFLESLPFHDAKERVISSVNAEEVVIASQARDLLGRQLANPVRWTKVMQQVGAIRDESDRTMLAEVGSGTVLTGLWKNSGLGGVSIPLGKETEIQDMRKEG